MDGLHHIGFALGAYAGAFFGLVIVGALAAGGFGWWSLLAWPASVGLGALAGSALDKM